jgi:Family of unknown function (DUF6527)
MRRQLDENGHLRLAEGDYGKDSRGIWQARPPGMHAGSLRNHEVEEHEDGTITVSPSILIDQGDKKWHGFLKKGEWSEC